MADPVTLPPITRVILQAEGRFFSLAWDGTAGITIAPGTGVGTAVHNGVAYALTAADPSASTGQDATYRTDVTTYNPDAPPSPAA